jgi:esterase/lipase superfamily enzyme
VCVLIKSADRGMAASRRSVLSAVTALLPLMLGGCTSLFATGARFDASQISGNPSMLVVTTRNSIDGARASPWFGTERASSPTVARAQLTAPGDGRFSLASIGLDDWRLDRVEPVPASVDQLGELASGGDVLLYVHGFNQTFETAVLDAARLSDAIRFRGDTMVFAWPSRAKLFDYGYDRDSAMWSRDALQAVLEQLLARPAGRVNIVAHSIGTMLALEALRQLHTQHGDGAAEHVGAVIFASPDIDMDVFTNSVRRIGPLARKIIVITATNDRALAVSRWMAGGMTRVGSAEKSRLEKLGLRVFDASQEGWGLINHDLFLSNSDVRALIRRVLETPDAPARNLVDSNRPADALGN